VLEIDPRRLVPREVAHKRMSDLARERPNLIMAPAIVTVWDGKMHICGVISVETGESLDATLTKEVMAEAAAAWPCESALANGMPQEFASSVLSMFSEMCSPAFSDGSYVIFLSTVPGDYKVSAELIAPISPPIRLKGFPGFWELFGYALSKSVRERTFEPEFHDLMACYLRTRSSEYRTPLARCWLNLCFTVRTFALVLECVRVAMLAGIVGTLVSLISPHVRQWAWGLYCNLFRR
jgi:hypothetical protein